MTKSDLISTIADAAGCSKGAAETAYDRLIDKIASTIPLRARRTYAGWAASSANGPKPARAATRAPGRKSRSPPDTGSNSSPRRRCAIGFRLRSRQKRPNKPGNRVLQTSAYQVENSCEVRPRRTPLDRTKQSGGTAVSEALFALKPIDIRTAAHGHIRGQGSGLGVHGSSPAVVSNPRSEPVSDDLMACCTRSSSHTVAACCGCTNIPRPAGGAQEAGTILSVGC